MQEKQEKNIKKREWNMRNKILLKHHRDIDKIIEYFVRFRKESSLFRSIPNSMGHVVNYDNFYDNTNPWLIGMALMPLAGKEKSLEFLKRLTSFLKQNDLCL